MWYNNHLMDQQLSFISKTSGDKTFAYGQIELNEENNLDTLCMRKSFQITKDFAKLFSIEIEIPYQLSKKLNKKSLLESEVLLGEGSFGSVYFTRHILLNINCALKIHHNITDEELLSLSNEYFIQAFLSKINESLFLSPIDKIYIRQQELNSYTTFAGLELGFINLYDYSIQVEIKDEEFEYIYYSILESIITMHDNKCAHRDIKPQNIIFVENKGWILSDFGCAIKYINQKGNYKICGTKAYLPIQYRQRLKQNFVEITSELDLFEIDIFAFQITLLQILNPSAKFIELQEKIDQQLSTHPLIDQFYNTTFSRVKSHRKKQYQQVKLQTCQSVVNKILERKNEKQYNENYIIKQKLGALETLRYNLSKIEKYSNLVDDLVQMKATLSQENIIYFEILLSILRNKKLNFNIEDIEINQNIKKWQYKIISDYLAHFGYVEKQYEYCIKYQGLKNKYCSYLQLQEIQLAFELGYYKEAKKRVNNLESSAYFYDDVSYLKYYCYRAKLNNQWWEVQQQAINYFKFLQIESLLYDIQFEIYYLKDQQEILTDFLNHDQDYKDLENPHSLLSQLLILESYENQDQETTQQLFKNRLTVFENYLNSKIPSAIKFIEILQREGYQFFQILYQLNELSVLYQQSENFDLALEFHLETINYINNNNRYPHITRQIYLNYAQFSVEIGNLAIAKEFSEKALLLTHKDDIFWRILTLQLLWYIQVQLGDFQQIKDSFILLMNYYKEFKGTKIKFGMIKRVYYGFQILIQSGHFELYHNHFLILKEYIENDSSISDSPDYSYLMHVLQWDFFYYQRQSQGMIEELNQFFITLSNGKRPYDSRVLQLQSNIASIGYFEPSFSISKKIQLFAKYLQSIIIYSDLFAFESNKECLTTDFAISQFIIAAEEDKVQHDIGKRIQIKLQVQYE